MRKAIEKQLKLGQTDIPDIEIDLDSRDDIPRILLGLQAIYKDEDTREKIFSILISAIGEKINLQNGRPGMELWIILVLATLRLGLNCDFDRVQELANQHITVREILGHVPYDKTKYPLQTIKDNLSLLTPEILEEINQVVVNFGHYICNHKDGDNLQGRCDSFVVETDVHFPTDANLLLDSIQPMIKLIALESEEWGLTEWRQNKHILQKFKGLFNIIIRMKPSKSKDEKQIEKKERLIIEAYENYIDTAEMYVERVKQTIFLLQNMGLGNIGRIIGIEYYITHAERQIDQIRRRVLKGENIPHHEKVFSIFEPHTEWISKGKAGVPQELGLRVCIIEDQYGFILHHHVMEKQTDDKVAVLMVSEAQKKFPSLNSCSFDKGFHSPSNQEQLGQFLDHVFLPRKGKLSKKAKEIEMAEDFKNARRKHPAVESAINALEVHGLDRCLDHGIYGFKRYVALAVVARNIHILGTKIRNNALKQRKSLSRTSKIPWSKAA